MQFKLINLTTTSRKYQSRINNETPFQDILDSTLTKLWRYWTLQRNNLHKQFIEDYYGRLEVLVFSILCYTEITHWKTRSPLLRALDKKVISKPSIWNQMLLDSEENPQCAIQKNFQHWVWFKFFQPYSTQVLKTSTQTLFFGYLSIFPLSKITILLTTRKD